MPDSTSDDRAFYWDWFKHEENLFTNRGSFFLVGESMLFAAVATLRSVDQAKATSALPIFYVLGVFVTVIWLATSTFHHVRTRQKIIAKLDQLEPRRSGISSTGGFYVKTHFWMGIMMPIGILITWLWLVIV